jgi:pimeloyl-ACP methyl ester carboxylesterase
MSTTAPTTADAHADAWPGSPEHAAFAKAQERLLRHYGVEARSRYVHLRRPDMRAHVLEAGRGDPVVILHGGDGQGVDWAPLMALLQDDFHLYALDRPAYGLSDPFDYRTVHLRTHAADFVTSAMDELGLEGATILGGSMGGFFALATAFRAPDRVRALGLIGMPVGLSRKVTLPMRAICGVPGLAARVIGGNGHPTVEGRKQQYRKMFHVDLASVPECYFDMQVAGMRIPGALPTWAALLRRVVSLRGMRPEVILAGELHRLEVPALVVWGDHDLAPTAVGREAAARMPRGEFVHLPGLGHFPFLEAPGETARALRKFLSANARVA